jgi:FkbM family methyltransferase
MELLAHDIHGTTFYYPKPLEACVSKVLAQPGEYWYPPLPDVDPYIRRVVDVGANVGAFAVWAYLRWPYAWIDCYEPHPLAAQLCAANAPPGSKVYPVAVTTLPAPTILLGVGDGEDWGWNTTQEDLRAATPIGAESIEVRTLHPRALPPADVLKVDAEGVELEVLRGYLHWDSLRLVMFEWHRERDFMELNALCEDKGLRLIRCTHDRINLGQCIWARTAVEYDHRTDSYVLPKEAP